MQQEGEAPTPEKVIVVHEAGSWTEAVVLRGLLESAGIESPPPDDARRIIAEYLAGNR